MRFISDWMVSSAQKTQKKPARGGFLLVVVVIARMKADGGQPRPRSLHQERNDEDDCIDWSRYRHLHLTNLDCDLQLHGFPHVARPQHRCLAACTGGLALEVTEGAEVIRVRPRVPFVSLAS